LLQLCDCALRCCVVRRVCIQVVVMCRNLRQARGGEMVLVVRPNGEL